MWTLFAKEANVSKRAIKEIAGYLVKI